MTIQRQHRDRLRSASDPSSVATRQQLRAAYEQAVAERVQRVSVSWICQRAGIARSTFYTHFSAVEDLAAYIVTSGFDELAEEDVLARASGVPGSTAARAGLARVMALLVGQRDLLEYAFAGGARPAVVANMVAWFALYTRETIATAYGALDERQIDVVAEYVSAGVVHAALLVLDEDGAAERAREVALLSELLPSALREQIEPGSGR